MKTKVETFPVSTWQVGFNCEICDDTGFILRTNGAAKPCPSANCQAGLDYRHQHISRLAAKSEIPERYKAQYGTWGPWDVLAADEGKVKGKLGAILAAQAFVHYRGTPFALADLDARWVKHPTPRHSVIVRGTNGVGKTALAVTVASQLIADLVAVQFITPRGLHFRLKNSFDGKTTESETSILRELTTVPVLFIDEFNTSATEYMVNIMEQIVRERYNTAMPIFATVNAGQDDLTKIWKVQTTSALFEMAHFIPMAGDVLRNEAVVPDSEQAF